MATPITTTAANKTALTSAAVNAKLIAAANKPRQRTRTWFRTRAPPAARAKPTLPRASKAPPPAFPG